jgi:hypothetical protein
MLSRVIATLVCAREENLHVEFSPSLLFDLEWWLHVVVQVVVDNAIFGDNTL